LITIKEEAIQEVEVKQEVIIEKPVQLPKPKVIKPVCYQNWLIFNS
jgi:hypothetical protein